MRAYLRLDPNLPDEKAEYPDGAYRAFVDTLCFAEHQPQRGRFRNAKLLAVLLEKRSRWIPYLIEHGDLITTESGALYVDGWDEWQEGDVTVSERMKRLRSRRKGVTPSDTPTVTPPTVTVPSERLAVGGKRLANSGGGAPSNGDAEPISFMGFRPKPRASLEAVKAQDDAEWEKCAKCGTRRGAHRAEHDFVVTA